MKKYILLDRDGVINYDSDEYIKSESEWRPIETSMEALKILHDLGYIVLVITNQSGVGRGYYTEETLKKIHDKMHKATVSAGGLITDIFYCPHKPEDNCKCRKPASDLLYQALDKYQFDPKSTYMVGDSLRDLEAAAPLGMKLALVKTGKGEKTMQNKILPSNTKCYENLLELSLELSTDTKLNL